jgi:hypothetical protein
VVTDGTAVAVAFGVSVAIGVSVASADCAKAGRIVAHARVNTIAALVAENTLNVLFMRSAIPSGRRAETAGYAGLV